MINAFANFINSYSGSGFIIVPLFYALYECLYIPPPNSPVEIKIFGLNAWSLK